MKARRPVIAARRLGCRYSGSVFPVLDRAGRELGEIVETEVHKALLASAQAVTSNVRENFSVPVRLRQDHENRKIEVISDGEGIRPNDFMRAMQDAKEKRKIHIDACVRAFQSEDFIDPVPYLPVSLVKHLYTDLIAAQLVLQDSFIKTVPDITVWGHQLQVTTVVTGVVMEHRKRLLRDPARAREVVDRVVASINTKAHPLIPERVANALYPGR